MNLCIHILWIIGHAYFLQTNHIWNCTTCYIQLQCSKIAWSWHWTSGLKQCFCFTSGFFERIFFLFFQCRKKLLKNTLKWICSFKGKNFFAPMPLNTIVLKTCFARIVDLPSLSFAWWVKKQVNTVDNDITLIMSLIWTLIQTKMREIRMISQSILIPWLHMIWNRVFLMYSPAP